MSAEDLKIKGNAFFKQKHYKQAFNCYSQAIELDPNNAIYFCNRAACYCAMDIDKYFINAIIDSESAIKLNPKYAKAYGRLAWICQQKDGIPKAVINYQRAINCLQKDKSHSVSQLKQYQKQIKLCQSKLRMQIQNQSALMALHSDLARQLFTPQNMKEKYRNYFTLSALGISKEHIPAYSGSEFEGEKSLGLYEILTYLAMMFRMLGDSPQSFVKVLDTQWLVSKHDNKENKDLNLSSIDKSISEMDKRVSDDYKCDHSLKYEKIRELEESKKQIEAVVSSADKSNLEMRGMFGLMVWKYDRGIDKLRQAIKNNESDADYEHFDCDDLTDENDMYGYPDCMAKRLLFEHGLMPWDEKVDSTLAKMYNW